MTPAEQVAEIRKVTQELMSQSRALLMDELLPELDSQGIHIRNYDELTDSAIAAV